MGCRVGMSTNPLARIGYWKSKEHHIGHAILASGLSYEQALLREATEAKVRGCVSSPGGEHIAGNVWSVYHVWGGAVP